MQGNLEVVTSEPVIVSSARRHQVADSDMLHAWRNPIDAWELDEDLTMLIGPSHSAQMLEIGVVNSDEGAVIVHAMTARPKFLRRRR